MKQKIEKLWRGKISFNQTFFLWFLLGNVVYFSGALFVLAYVGSFMSQEEAVPYIWGMLIFFTLTIAYFPITTVGVWRSAHIHLSNKAIILADLVIIPLALFAVLYTIIIFGACIENLFLL